MTNCDCDHKNLKCMDCFREVPPYNPSLAEMSLAQFMEDLESHIETAEAMNLLSKENPDGVIWICIQGIYDLLEKYK